MERVVEWSLRENSDKYGKISKLQHAYCSTKGTDTALSTLVNMIESCILRSKICLVLSVDIKGAFNNLATKTIHKVLVDIKYPPIMIRWYMNFLKNRNSIAEVLGIIKTIRPVCGTPQGGVLSSRIWNLAFDPLLKLLNDNSPCSPVGFADDELSVSWALTQIPWWPMLKNTLTWQLNGGHKMASHSVQKKQLWSSLPESITFIRKFYLR